MVYYMDKKDLTILEQLQNSLCGALDCIKNLIRQFNNDTKLENISNIFNATSDLHDLVIKSVKHDKSEEVYADEFLEKFARIFSKE